MFKSRALATAGLVLALVGGGATAASAATASTSIGNWYAGDVGSWRSDNAGVTQSINLQGCSVNGGNTPSSVQMQLQRANGAVPISEGNITNACGVTSSWAQGAAGQQHRYQYNGHTFQGQFYRGPFVASNVTIQY